MEDIQKLMFECAKLAKAIGCYQGIHIAVSEENGEIFFQLTIEQHPYPYWVRMKTLYHGLIEMKSMLMKAVQRDIQGTLGHAQTRAEDLGKVLLEVGCC